jgi:DNA-binding protein HU-beta
MATKAGKKRMTQSEVFNHFAEKTGLKRSQVKEIFEELANLASSEVKNNGEFARSAKRARDVTRRPARPSKSPPRRP